MQKKKYNSIKQKLSNLFLLKKLEKQDNNTSVCSPEKAKTIGITFVATSEKDIENIKKTIKRISSYNAEVFMLGYIPEKKPDDFYLSQKGLDFFYDKELDWLLRPKSEAAVNFQNMAFDILIDFDTIDYYPMYLLMLQSKAKFKIGFYNEKKPFDMMLQIDNKKTDKFNYYIEQVMLYLSKFN